MEIRRKLGGTTPVCNGTSSHFALERSLVIFELWPSELATLCKNLVRIVVFWVCHTHLKHCVDQHFQISPRLSSGHVIPLYGGVSKSSRLPCILSTRSMKAVTQTIKFDKSDTIYHKSC